MLPDTWPQMNRLRNGGYTRVVRIGHRYGDAADRAIIEFIDRYEYVRCGIETLGSGWVVCVYWTWTQGKRKYSKNLFQSITNIATIHLTTPPHRHKQNSEGELRKPRPPSGTLPDEIPVVLAEPLDGDEVYDSDATIVVKEEDLKI